MRFFGFGKRADAVGALLSSLAILLTFVSSSSVSSGNGAGGQGSEVARVVNTSDLLKQDKVVLNGPWVLKGDMNLKGNDRLTLVDATVNLEGNVFLKDNAVFSVQNSVFNLAQQRGFQYHIEARNNSTLVLKNSELKTNRGEGNELFPSSFVGYDDATLILEDSRLEYKQNWLLGGFHDRAKLVSTNCQHLPTEIYPEDASTLTIRGEKSASLVWLEFPAKTFAVLDGFPDTSKPFTLRFGRSTPAKTNVQFDVEIVNAAIGLSVKSNPLSDITIKNNQAPIQIGYYFAGTTSAEAVSGLQEGLQDRTFTNQGRTLQLRSATAGAWQVYATNTKEPVQIKDSTMNELVAFEGGKFQIENCKFLYAAIGAMGTGSKVEISQSDIPVWAILSSQDGVVTIRDSVIHGSMVQATDTSRVILLNNKLALNANPYFGGADTSVRFISEGSASVIVLGITPPETPIPRGKNLKFMGDAFVESQVPGLTGTYDLYYRKSDQQALGSVVTGVRDKRKGEALGSLNTGVLSPGDYVALLRLALMDGSTFEVQRPFAVSE